VNCYRCPRDTYLRELAAAVGCELGGAALKDDPLAYLGDLVRQRPSAPEPAPLPSPGELAGWQARLLSSGAALEYLLNERGLTEEVIARYELGYDGRAFTLPVYSIRGHRLVNLRRRAWPELFPGGAKYQGLRGRNKRNGGVSLYPALPRRGALLLCGGELDALVAHVHGLPGIACTAGVATAWKGAWDRLVRGRAVVVVYDVGEEQQAASRVSALGAAGALAWAVDLGAAGLQDKEDLTDFFVKHGHTADELRALVRAAHPSRRHRKGRRRHGR
jgi:hypothetical protein